MISIEKARIDLVKHRKSKAEPVKWRALAWWITATIVGWAILWSPVTGSSNTMLFDWAMTWGMWDMTYPILGAWGGAFSGALSGLVLSIGQWQTIKASGQSRTVSAWVWLTSLGMAAGWGLNQALAYPLLTYLRIAQGWQLGDDPGSVNSAIIIVANAALSGAIVGILVGVCQWLALRKWVQHSGWWILVCALAWTLGASLCWLSYLILGGPLCQGLNCIDENVGPNYYQVMLISWLLGGGVVGFITRGAVEVLGRHPANAERPS